MRPLMRLFPREWRERFGREFIEQFDADQRRRMKWVDAWRTAAGLRLESVRGGSDGLAMGLVIALAMTAGCDVTMGIGLDERLDSDVFRHWWAAPFAAALVLSAALTAGILAIIFRDRRRRRNTALLAVGIAGGSFAGSAIVAAVAPAFAGVGAGAGLMIAVIVARLVLRTPRARADILILVALPMVLWLGWRSASGPIGPVVLIVTVAALLATRARTDRVDLRASAG